MKIVFLSYYSGEVNRGVEVFVAELSRRLSDRHEVKVISAAHQTDLPEFSKYRFGWRFYLDPAGLAVKRFTQKALLSLDPKTDILVPTNGGWQSFLSRLWAWRHGARVVISGHAGIGWDDRINLLTRPDVFVALTQKQKTWAEKWSFGLRVEKIPDGVDLKEFRSQVKPVETGLPKPLILCVAALEKDKRIDLTIEAVSRLNRGSLLVLGSGSEKDRLEKLGLERLGGRFRLLSVPHRKMPGFYAAADVFTMAPVETESFGMVYLEAMACGLPVVATNDPVRQEIVGEAGTLVDPKDVDQYVKTLETVLGKKWNNEPRKQAEKFSWDETVKKYDELFRSLK